MGEIKRLGLAQQLWRHGHIGHVKLLGQLSKAGLEVRTFAGITRAPLKSDSGRQQLPRDHGWHARQAGGLQLSC